MLYKNQTIFQYVGMYRYIVFKLSTCQALLDFYFFISESNMLRITTFFSKCLIFFSFFFLKSCFSLSWNLYNVLGHVCIKLTSCIINWIDNQFDLFISITLYKFACHLLITKHIKLQKVNFLTIILICSVAKNGIEVSNLYMFE